MNPNFEILAPAGNLDILKAVIHAGADAVYIGGSKFGARAYANNFTEEEVIEALHFAHLRGKKVCMTVNTLFKNEEMKELYEYLRPYYEEGLDAVIVQDMGAIASIHQWFPDLPIHTSTQLTVTGMEGAELMKQFGVTRIVMAREVSLEEMHKIHEACGLEIEAFIHGALCYSYSGQCLFSSLLGGRSGNRGRCAQPCRLPYTVLDKDGKTLRNESYILSLKDFCGIRSLKEFQDAGVYSLKIEGRMKQAGYAASVVRMYRKYADLLYEKPDSYAMTEDDFALLKSFGNRCGFTDTFLHSHNATSMVTYEKPSFLSEAEYEEKEKCYVPISGEFHAKIGENCSLTIVHPLLEKPITVTGPAVSAAKNAPITEADLAERLQKTKDTAFLFQNLAITMDENVFLPNGLINQVRRDGIFALEDALLAKYKRFADSSLHVDPAFFPAKEENPMQGNSITLENRSLLDAALSCDWASAIGISTDAYIGYDQLQKQLPLDFQQIHAKGKNALLILPSIFREETRGDFLSLLPSVESATPDGFLVKNLEELAFCKKHFPSIPIVLDHNLYTFNNLAKAGYTAFGIAGDTVPLELNQKEIARRDNRDSVMMIYGYYPLMTTANCVCKNTKGCKQEREQLYLLDRYKKTFPVRNYCNSCYNVIYNSLPTMLLNKLHTIAELGIENYRFHFSVETESEAVQVMSMIGRVLQGDKLDVSSSDQASYTNGHFTRGVE